MNRFFLLLWYSYQVFLAGNTISVTLILMENRYVVNGTTFSFLFYFILFIVTFIL